MHETTGVEEPRLGPKVWERKSPMNWTGLFARPSGLQVGFKVP